MQCTADWRASILQTTNEKPLLDTAYANHSRDGMTKAHSCEGYGLYASHYCRNGEKEPASKRRRKVRLEAENAHAVSELSEAVQGNLEDA
jgi:hypothetical protein